MPIGCARVSTVLQTTEGQIDSLKADESGYSPRHCPAPFADRPQLAAALGYMREGDVLVVVRLVRLGQTLGYSDGLSWR